MFSIPDETVHRTKVADWLELESIASPDGRVGFGTLIAAAAVSEDEQPKDMADEDIKEDDLVLSAQAEIERRQKNIGDDYPFRISDNGRAMQFITPVSKAGSVYLFCLFLSHAFDRTIVPKALAPRVTNKARDLFQACATVAAGGYVHGPSISFGFPRPDGTTFLKALHRVYNLFGDGTPRKKPRAAAVKRIKDSGIDIIAWKRSIDNLPCTLYLIAQVASGADWEDKSVLTDREHFHKYWFTTIPASQPTDAMFIPFGLEPEDPEDGTPYEGVLKDYMQSKGYKFGTLFYRDRVAKHLADGLQLVAAGEKGIERVPDIVKVVTWVERYTKRLKAASHRFHSICPYFAMFPESFVRRNVLAWSKRGDVILDPFSGRGTTVFESLLNGRLAIGCDINPVAACLSKAKADAPARQQVLDRLDVLEQASLRFSGSRATELQNEFFTLCFHETTLRQLLFLRKELDWRADRTNCFIAALALGCLHGESHRTELCFSNRMPRTISTKPAYSVRWWKERRCLPPPRDVFAILRTAAEFRYGSPLPQLTGRVVEGDVRRASALLRSYRQKVKLVITSPPYLDITDYHEDQWLRLWFLGGAAKPVTRQGKDDRHRSIEAYWQFLREAWKGIAPLLQESAQIVVRIGGTRLDQVQLQAGLLESLNSTGQNFRLAESHQTVIKNGQRRIFQVPTDRAVLERDLRFRLA